MTVTSYSKNKPMGSGDKLYKYWMQRYNLFSRFDDGILLDDVSWYSVTPESIAQHIARRVLNAKGDGHLIVVDGFCGVGGNVIQFACCSPFVRVIACDIDENRLKMAKHNARIYGVQHQCEFILGDFMELMPNLESFVDVVFLSPPWGGIDYKDSNNYSLSSMSPDGFYIVNQCRKYLTKDIAFLMPRNVDIQELRGKLLDKDNPLFEYEQNMIGNKIKTITVYFGNLVDQSSDTDSDD